MKEIELAVNYGRLDAYKEVLNYIADQVTLVKSGMIKDINVHELVVFLRSQSKKISVDKPVDIG